MSHTTLPPAVSPLQAGGCSLVPPYPLGAVLVAVHGVAENVLVLVAGEVTTFVIALRLPCPVLLAGAPLIDMVIVIMVGTVHAFETGADDAAVLVCPVSHDFFLSCLFYMMSCVFHILGLTHLQILIVSFSAN